MYFKNRKSGRAPVGTKFGRLTVIGEEFATFINPRQKHLCVVVQCECGEYRCYPVGNLVRGRCTSCGCMKGHQKKKHWTHGGYDTKLYGIWNGMRQRCNNKKCRGYHVYGGKGIKVCDAWSDFTIFRDWANATGYQEGLSIDRINPDKGYAPDNCQWLTREENGRKVKTDADAKLAAKDSLINALAFTLANVLEVCA
jgi:hypothetical protein